MDDNNNEIMKFVLLVEKYPCLYNHTLPEHCRKDLTEKAWNAISQKMKWSGNLKSIYYIRCYKQ